MPRFRVDLHNHSPFVFTDYRRPDATAEEMVTAAVAARVDVLALTDHTAIGWYGELWRAAADRLRQSGERLLVLPGCELKVVWGTDEVHLVVLFPPEEAEQLFGVLTGLLGIGERVHDPAELPGVKVERDPVDVVRQADALGALCHVAHVDRWFGTFRLLGGPTLDRLLHEAPLSAVEVLDEDSEAVLRAAAPHLPFIRSSDAHSPEDIGRRTVELEMRELSFDALRDTLFASRSPVRSDHVALP